MGRIAEEREKVQVRLDKIERIFYINSGDLYPKAENTNVQMKLKPLWFGLFLTVRLAAHVSNGLKSRIRPVVGRI